MQICYNCYFHLYYLFNTLKNSFLYFSETTFSEYFSSIVLWAFFPNFSRKLLFLYNSNTASATFSAVACIIGIPTLFSLIKEFKSSLSEHIPIIGIPHAIILYALLGR